MVMGCPGCGNTSLVNTMETLDVPYFPDLFSTVLTCENCGFRHVDFINTKMGRPLRHRLKISSPDDLSIRIVRSTSATIKVPELGTIIEPGPASEGFISNTEGVLNRIRDIIESAKLRAEDQKTQIKADELLKKIDRIISGEESAYLILEDPFGNSAIISKDAEEEELSEEEVKGLKVGMFVMDVKDMETGQD